MYIDIFTLNAFLFILLDFKSWIYLDLARSAIWGAYPQTGMQPWGVLNFGIPKIEYTRKVDFPILLL